MAFVKPPTHVGIPWRFDVTLVKWVPDILLTLNFAGDAHDLQGHPLQIDSVEPAGAVWEDAITKHSVTYRLRPVEGDDPGALHIVAYGMVSGLGQVTCCCAPPPPPPPLPPPSPAPLPPPSPWPRPPPPPPFSHLKNMHFEGTESKAGLNHAPIDAAATTSSSASEVTRIVWLCVLAALALGYYTRKSFLQLRDHLLFRRLKQKVTQRLNEANRHGSPGEEDDDDDSVDPESDGLTRQCRGTTLCMTMPSGVTHDVSIDLESIDTIGQLQGLVLGEWVQFGGERCDSLMMEHVDRRGRATKVSKVTTLAMLKASRTLNLMPKRSRKTKDTGTVQQYGRLKQDGPAKGKLSGAGRGGATRALPYVVPRDDLE